MSIFENIPKYSFIFVLNFFWKIFFPKILVFIFKNTFYQIYLYQ